MKSFKNIALTVSVFVLLSLTSIACKDSFSIPSSEKSAESKGYLCIKLEDNGFLEETGSINESARTVLPVDKVTDLKDFVLYMYCSADGSTNTYNFADYDSLISSKIGVEPGYWQFKLSSGDFSSTIYKTIESGNNSLSFSLKYTGSADSGNVEVSIELPDDPRIKLIKLELLNQAEDLQYRLQVLNLTRENNKISALYSGKNISKGYYVIKWNVYGDSAGKILLDSKKDLLLVETDLTSKKEIELENPLTIYDITYNLNGGSFKEGFTPQNAYSSLSDFDLPGQNNVSSEGKFFEGWYTTAAFTGDKLSFVKAGTMGNLTLYAKWNDSDIKLVEKTEASSSLDDYCLINLEPNDTVEEMWYFEPGYTYYGVWADFQSNNSQILSDNGFDSTDAKLNIFSESNDLIVSVDDEISFDFSVPEKGFYKVALTNVFNKTGYCTFYIYKVGKNYSISFRTNGGTVSSSITLPTSYTSDQEIYLPENIYITKPHCFFTGWYETEECNTVPVKRIPVGAYGEKVFYAGWQGELYSIHYELNGGTNSEGNPLYYKVTDSIKLSAPEREGYSFCGWYEEEDFSGTEQIEMDSGSYGDKTYYAKWLEKYFITYELNGGINAEDNPENYTIESDTIPLVAPAKEGFLFRGWYEEEDFSGTEQTEIITGSNGVKTYYAKWLKKCTVSFVTEHGTAPESIVVGEGEIVEAAQIVQLSEKDWLFRGWYTDSSFADEKKISSDFVVTNDIEVYARWEEYTGPDDEFVFVEGGTVIGSSDYNRDYTGVFPAGRTVTLSSFYICDHEVTQKEYTEVIGINPSYYTSNPVSGETQEKRPVEQVSWYDAIYFCNKYSELQGITPCYAVNGDKNVSNWNYIPHNETIINGTITCDWNANGYRLPTEAEWEFAARGGMKTYGTAAFAYRYSGSDSYESVMWYLSNSNSITHEVKKKAPNALSLYDMSGNVMEFCWDLYGGSVSSGNVTDPNGATGNYRMIRGGSKSSFAYFGSVSERICCDRDSYVRNKEHGFRIVRTDTSSCYTISYQTAHGTVPQAFYVENGTVLTTENLPVLTEKGWKFLGWYTSRNFDEITKASEGQSITESITLYAKWEEYAGPEVLPAGTDGTAGTSAKYVHFGEWPQTIKANNVTVNESVSEVHGAFTYYSGSDGYWYVKCRENAYESWYTYSNGTTVAQNNANSTKYFKVEPIKWRVLTENYNGTGKALLLAESVLTGNVPYYISSSNRTIGSLNVYANNYKYSTIRAYLNGTYESNDPQTNTYTNKGFLQTAFTEKAQNLIATTTVDNSATSTTDSGNNLNQATSYACANTNDKIFLLSEKEVTTSSYGFASYNSYAPPNTRIRVTTDFAKANYAYYWATDGYGGWWWLRSPAFDSKNYALAVDIGGCVNYYRNDVYYAFGNVVPALTISLQ